MKFRKTTVGAFAALLISVSAAAALPLVNVFTTLATSELMMVRGGVTALLFVLLLRKHVSTPSRRILFFSGLFSLATLCLYEGIRSWGANPTLVVGAATPIVNIAAKLLRGQSVDRRVYICLGGLLAGVAIALNPWSASFHLWGFAVSVAGTLLAGLAFEVLGGQKGVNQYNKSFWLGLVTLAVGLVVTLVNGQVPFAGEVWSPLYVLALVFFGAMGGFVYYLSIIVSVENLKTEVASTLAMAETPLVIVSAWLMLGEKFSPVQWAGVALALLATGVLGILESRKTEDSGS